MMPLGTHDALECSARFERRPRLPCWRWLALGGLLAAEILGMSVASIPAIWRDNELGGLA